MEIEPAEKINFSYGRSETLRLHLISLPNFAKYEPEPEFRETDLYFPFSLLANETLESQENTPALKKRIIVRYEAKNAMGTEIRGVKACIFMTRYKDDLSWQPTTTNFSGLE